MCLLATSLHDFLGAAALVAGFLAAAVPAGFLSMVAAGAFEAAGLFIALPGLQSCKGLILHGFQRLLVIVLLAKGFATNHGKEEWHLFMFFFGSNLKNNEEVTPVEALIFPLAHLLMAVALGHGQV